MASPVPVFRYANRKKKTESGPSAFGQRHFSLLTYIHGHDRELSGLQFPSLVNVTNNTNSRGLFHGHTSSFALQK